jgi:hypothetical protein
MDVLFSTNRRIYNDEGFHVERYGAHHYINTWRKFILTAGF